MKGLIKLILSALIFIVLLTWTLIFIGESRDIPPFGEDYATIRLFDPDGFSSAEISAIRFTADSVSESTPDTQRLWCDAYSRFETASVNNDNGKSTESACVVTGGNWFLFHNLDFLHGWYYSDTDLNFDRVVIDERLAFQLFGSSNCEGMRVYVSGTPCYVAGVVALDESDAYKAQLEEKPMIYIPENIAEKIFGMKDFDYYEICMQNPVDSHALNSLKEVTEGKTAIDVTSRYSLKNTFSNLKSFTSRSIITEEEPLPFWENDDRQREDTLVILEVLVAVSFVFFVLNLILFIIERKKR
ncbi:MAG: ABC transporter permease [Clostridia bacterium]|nr:ABC transporter permease [Clostridia bacterium]MBQ7897763.1 ABC transporter permease [Clostridia bacterium]